MPLLDIQQRFRELGRIRTGVKVPTSKGKMRPTKLPRFRLTSPWRHLIDAGAEVFGGEVKPWDNGGAQEWEVIVEVDALDVIVPPGEILSQWYEMWTGGGCIRRCDGIRQVLQDRPCSCPKEPNERTEKAAKNPPEACKPTTRLNVMIPQIPDLGVWRLESHGYYAATELAPAAGLCELATRRGAMIPADLRLVAREGARRPGEVRKKFFVPAISFRGALGPVLEAIGMDTSAPALLLGVQPRPALDAGGRRELPAGGTPFDPEARPVEEAQVPTAAPPVPDAGDFVPPLNGSRQEDHEGSVESRAQTIAMRCREVGIDRAQLISAITGGRATSAKDVTAEEASEIFLAVVRIARGELVLSEVDGAWRLAKPAPVAAAGEGDGSPPADPPSKPPEAVKPEVVEGPPTVRSEGGAEQQSAEGYPPVEEETWDGVQWREYLRPRQIKVSEVIRKAQELAGNLKVDPPTTLDQLKGNRNLASLVRGFVEDLAEQRGYRP